MYKALLSSLIIFSSFYASSQQLYDQDARLWLYIKMDKRITKNLSMQLLLQNRIQNNVSEFSQFNINPELSYKLSKNFKLLFGYVYGFTRKPEKFYLPRQQAYGGFIARAKAGHFTFLYRNIIQGQTSASYNLDKAKRITYYDRNKLTVKYEINKRFEVYVAEEVNLPTLQMPEYFYITRSRSYIGGAYNLSKRSYIELYFLFQRKYADAFWPHRDFIYGITYSYDFH